MTQVCQKCGAARDDREFRKRRPGVCASCLIDELVPPMEPKDNSKGNPEMPMSDAEVRMLTGHLGNFGASAAPSMQDVKVSRTVDGGVSCDLACAIRYDTAGRET